MREREELHRELVERSPDGILLIEDARIAFVNPAAARLCGATSPDQLSARPVVDLFHPDSHATLLVRLAQAQTGQAMPRDRQPYRFGRAAVLAGPILLTPSAISSSKSSATYWRRESGS